MPRPTKPPLPCSINKIHRQRNECTKQKKPAEKHQGHNQLLNKVNLERYESPETNPQPLSSFLFVRFVRQVP